MAGNGDELKTSHGGNSVITVVSDSPDYSVPEKDESAETAGLGRRFVDSFKRDPAHVSLVHGSGGKNGGFDAEAAAANTAASPLKRQLKSRHLQMIAIGGSIGMCLCLWP